MFDRFFTIIVVLVSFMSNALAQNTDAIWSKNIRVDDFDDSKTYISTLQARNQGHLIVRYHESSQREYEIFYSPSGFFLLCGESGSILEGGSYANIQIRADKGKIMTFSGNRSTDNQAVFLKDGLDTTNALIRALKKAKKVVIRFKDNCHQDGATYIFGKFENISGTNFLEEILLSLHL